MLKKSFYITYYMYIHNTCVIDISSDVKNSCIDKNSRKFHWETWNPGNDMLSGCIPHENQRSYACVYCVLQEYFHGIGLYL